MRRYLSDYNLSEMGKIYCDVVIVGSGLAGLYTALNIDENLSCVVLSKEKGDSSSSYLAQGGIASVFSKDDCMQSHFNDTLNAGAQLCDKEAVRVLVNEGPKEIERLISVGIDFDTDKSGNLHITKEGGHSRNRILHCGGDATGREVVKKLTEVVSNKRNVVFKNNIFVVDIITYEGKTEGVIVYDEGYKVYVSQNVVICSGGIGQVYKYSTNPSVATGDGIAAAYRAGASLENMEFIQFHPTAFCPEEKEQRLFLISEAVRGEGAILKNKRGERFMQGRHPMNELAPRDIVAREIYRQMKLNNSSCVYLDITSKSEDFLSKRFPTIYNECMKKGINISKQYIPVCPVQHYFMGGIKTDINGKSNVEGLYSCGEAACTGIHGANRLASNSLLECLVFGRRCAQYINTHFNKKIDNIVINSKRNKIEKVEYSILKNAAFLKQRISEVMNSYGGIIRNKDDLNKGLKEINDILIIIEKSILETQQQMEIYNIALIARQILLAATKREKSVGAHYREN